MTDEGTTCLSSSTQMANMGWSCGRSLIYGVLKGNRLKNYKLLGLEHTDYLLKDNFTVGFSKEHVGIESQ